MSGAAVTAITLMRPASSSDALDATSDADVTAAEQDSKDREMTLDRVDEDTAALLSDRDPPHVDNHVVTVAQCRRETAAASDSCIQVCLFVFPCLLVHGQVTIILVVSVCLFVCLCRVFLSRL